MPEPKVNAPYNRPFPEQLAFFKAKLELPTAHYDDILKAAHDRAFIVAGALKADLLNDLQQSVTQAIGEGKSIQWFRKEFGAIVAKHGWTGWTGEDSPAGVAWRTRVIYQTNLTTSYAAGRFAQLNDPDLLRHRPYWKYVHNDTVQHPRPLHQAWGRKPVVLPPDDPWWRTHFPPNGWGCRCQLVAVRADEYRGEPAPDDGTWTKIDRWGEAHTIPKGVDYGWDYAPGASRLKPFQALIDDKLIRFPAPLGAALWQALKPVLFAERATAYRQWLLSIASDNTAKSLTPVIGAMDAKDLAWLSENAKPIPNSAEIAISSATINGPKAVRHAAKGDAVADAVWEYLPEMLAEPLAALFDEHRGTLLYVLPEASSRRPQVTIEFAFQRRKPGPNLIISAYRPALADLLARLRNGSLSLMRGSLE